MSTPSERLQLAAYMMHEARRQQNAHDFAKVSFSYAVGENAGLGKQLAAVGGDIAAGMAIPGYTTLTEGAQALKNFRAGNMWSGAGNLALAGLGAVPVLGGATVGAIRGGARLARIAGKAAPTMTKLMPTTMKTMGGAKNLAVGAKNLGAKAMTKAAPVTKAMFPTVTSAVKGVRSGMNAAGKTKPVQFMNRHQMGVNMAGQGLNMGLGAAQDGINAGKAIQTQTGLVNPLMAASRNMRAPDIMNAGGGVNPNFAGLVG
jgi:hypothetical protein